jgi:hypothetical protein
MRGEQNLRGRRRRRERERKDGMNRGTYIKTSEGQGRVTLGLTRAV